MALGATCCESPTLVSTQPSEWPSPSQSWRTCLDNHAEEIVAMDFFTVPTATFRVLYVLMMALYFLENTQGAARTCERRSTIRSGKREL